MRVMPYKMSSKSGKILADALGCQRVRPNGDFRNNFNHTIINWGYSGDVNFSSLHMYNEPVWVERASNKLKAFQSFKYHCIPTPKWTTDTDEAHGWWASGKTVLLRHILNGHSGKGIEVYTGESYDVSPLDFTLPYAPLYVQYIKKQDEYRYHVFNGQVIDIQQKKKRRSTSNDQVNYQVRSNDTGWCYCRTGIHPDSSLNSMAVSAVASLGLDFGAVDIIWNERQQQGYVLEVNTAPGLNGHTIEVYTDAILNII